MKKMMKNVAFVAAIVSVFGLCACESGEKIERKVQGGSTIVVNNGYETSLVVSPSVNNNGTESTGIVKGVGSITTDLESENPIENTLDANAEAKVSLQKNIVTVSAENAGVVTLLENTPAETQDLSTEKEVKKSSNKTFTFSDGQSADAVWAYAYTNAKLTIPVAVPHVEITEVNYIDYTATQIADNQYKIVMHFRANYKTFGVRTPQTGNLDLYPEYIQEVEAVAPQFSYEEKIEFEFIKQDKSIQMMWQLTRNDGKVFRIWATVAKFYEAKGFDELHVTSGDIVSSHNKDLSTKEECIAAFAPCATCFFEKDEKEFHLSSRVIGKEIQRTWMAESGVAIEGMGVTAMFQMVDVSFTDPETGYSVTKSFNGTQNIRKEEFVNMNKSGIEIQGKHAPYISSYQLTLDYNLEGPDGYKYTYTCIPTTNLYKVGK